MLAIMSQAAAMVASKSLARRRLRPLINLAASNQRGPPLSVVFTDWLSITPADRLASLPPASRAAKSGSRLILFSVPSARHAQKYSRTVLFGGKSFGNIRH